ncbi:hypothetical protein ACLOJK_004341 [Asimina triloba]
MRKQFRILIVHDSAIVHNTAALQLQMGLVTHPNQTQELKLIKLEKGTFDIMYTAGAPYYGAPSSSKGLQWQIHLLRLTKSAAARANQAVHPWQLRQQKDRPRTSSPNHPNRLAPSSNIRKPRQLKTGDPSLIPIPKSVRAAWATVSSRPTIQSK